MVYDAMHKYILKTPGSKPGRGLSIGGHIPFRVNDDSGVGQLAAEYDSELDQSDPHYLSSLQKGDHILGHF